MAFSLHILQGNLDVLHYDSLTFGVYGVDVRQYHFLLCFPFVSSPQTLLKMTCNCIAVFHFFFHHLHPHTSLHPHFINLISCFSHPDQHGDHLHSDNFVALRVFTLWAVPVFIYINLISFSLPVDTLLLQFHHLLTPVDMFHSY